MVHLSIPSLLLWAPVGLRSIRDLECVSPGGVASCGIGHRPASPRWGAALAVSCSSSFFLFLRAPGPSIRFRMGTRLFSGFRHSLASPSWGHRRSSSSPFPSLALWATLGLRFFGIWGVSRSVALRAAGVGSFSSSQLVDGGCSQLLPILLSLSTGPWAVDSIQGWNASASRPRLGPALSVPLPVRRCDPLMSERGADPAAQVTLLHLEPVGPKWQRSGKPLVAGGCASPILYLKPSAGRGDIHRPGYSSARH